MLLLLLLMFLKFNNRIKKCHFESGKEIINGFVYQTAAIKFNFQYYLRGFKGVIT